MIINQPGLRGMMWVPGLSLNWVGGSSYHECVEELEMGRNMG